MIDYTQFWVKDMAEISRLWKHPILYSKNKVEKINKSTGEIYIKQTKEFEGITFRKEKHYPTKPNEGNERIVIGFKPHYWHNQDKHNANDFTSLICIKTIQRFISIFNIQVYENYPINNLEYGLNFLLNGFGKEFIGYNIYHSRNLFIQDQDHQYAKRAHSYTKGKPNYYSYAKLYCKGFQYPQYCDKNTLRFEIGTKQSKNIKRLGIKNIGDLLNIGIYHDLKKFLTNNALNVLIIDQHPKLSNLSKRDSNRLIKFTNSSFWYDVLQKRRSAIFNEKKESYFDLLERTGNNLNTEFQKSIKAKLEILLPEKRKDSTTLTKPEKRKYSTLDKGGKLTVSNSRLCPITGYDISMQKPNSNLLSNTGLKYYEKHQPDIFDLLKSKLLTGEENKFEKDIYSMISKQIRNRFYSKGGRFNSAQISLL